LLCVLVLLLAAAPARAMLGDTLGDLTKHRGKPAGQTSKNNAVWLFEGEDGQLLYTVTFDASGHSIAEGLKPVKNAKFGREVAVDFIKAQIEPIKNSKTLHEVKTGEKYHFAQQEFSVAGDEYVLVDEANGVLIVWNQSALPSVMAVTPAVIR
jgi:hypothetical protein